MLQAGQSLDDIISKLSKDKKICNDARKTSRILLVSETNNACLSLSSSDEEHDEGEPDLHQCGHCKLMFNNLSKYITHKLQKVCWSENATAEEPAWSLDRNGSSSPETSTKEEADEEIEQLLQSNIKVKNLNQDLQKRKHRKGLVRRLKPPSNSEEKVESPTKVYIPDEEGTMFVQQVQQDDNKERSSVNTFDGKKMLSTTECDVANMSGKTSEESQDIYEYSPKSLTTAYPIPNKSPDTSDIAPPFSSPTAYSLAQKTSKSLDSTNEHSHLHYYSQVDPSKVGSSKFDRVPPKLPQIMSIHGFSGGYDYRDMPYSSKYEQYTPDHHKPKYHSYYETDTSSTWISAKSSRQNKYSPYEKYRTMANLDGTDMNLKAVPSFISRSDPQLASNELSKMDVSQKESKIIETETTGDTTEPPELVRILPDKEKASLDKASPPTLEKCDTPVYVEPNLKVEEDASHDSLQESMEVQTDKTTEKSDNIQEQGLSSPEKETNSPVDSAHSHETEEFTQEQTNPDTTETYLPQHRRLSESTVERLITEPSSQGADASWKHAKQVYRCPLCAKIFPFKSKLQRHVLVHTGIKPYKCTVCGRGFTQQIDLQRHLTRHTGEKPFKCHLCKAQFIRADNLRKHCKDAHYVNIEEPIRKRRRKTTGSDTVLPPLEVAIALALSETERNGGRVLGRAVTKSATKTTTSIKTRQEQRRSEEANTASYSHQPRLLHPEVPSYQAVYPPHLVTRHDLRYPFQPKIDSNQPYAIHRRPGSPTVERPSSPDRKGLEQRGGYPPSESPRYYKNQPLSAVAYYSHPPHERETSEMRFQDRERAVRLNNPRIPPEHRFIDPRYPVEYRSMAIDSRSQGYMSRPPEHRHRLPNEYEYSNRRGSEVPLVHKRSDDVDEFPDRRTMVDADYTMKYVSSPRDNDVVQPRSEREDVTGYRGDEPFDARATFINRYSSKHQQKSDTGRFVVPHLDRDTHRAVFLDKASVNYGDHSQIRSDRSPEMQDGRGDRAEYRNVESYDKYEGRSMVGKNSSADPGEYISMATDRNRFSTSPGSVNKPGEENVEKSNAHVVAQDNVYVDEQETPIVTPSDDLAMVSKGAV
ncbi:uncharacterized protein LOC130625771 isoform X4 [Hydractinia symbiolongicarpus]|uniref:uncharacterized protein LOC130625771 isoform X4 n=1 Tax=Hydractinia symbiolongicarpus TaxID=13093 RepID=UPI00255120FD|nr:uncharacterized protein LOC130625771 isoform X4 [Hydractinia symbiolongicarpus]